MQNLPLSHNKSTNSYRTFAHTDLFCINLYGFSATHTIKPIANAISATSEAISSCSNGLILVVDRSMAAVSRVWCLWEVFLAAYRKGEVSVRLALPGG